MKPSTVAIWFANKVPKFSSFALRIWANLNGRQGSNEHWLFHRLKSQSYLRLRRRARLITGQSLYVDPYDSVGGEIFHSGCYERETVVLLQRLLRPGMVVVDAGSHIGQYTVIASQLVKEGTVHAFEPDPITFRQLEENVALNSCRNVSCNCAALSRELGYGSLYLSAVDNIGGNSLRPTGCYAGDQTTVSLQTLDHYAGLVDLARLDVLKADVEGAELFLLEGGEQVISRFHPVVILEFSIHTKAYGYTPKHLEEKLKKWGYLLFKIGPIPLAPLTLSSSDPPYLNVLAVHQEQVEDLLSRKLVHPHGLEPR